MFSLERKLAELQERAKDCAQRLGYHDVDKLLQDLRQCADLQRRTATLERLQEEQQLLRQELAAAEEQAADLLSRAGRRREAATAPSVETLQGALEKRQQHTRRRDDLERRQLLGTQETSTLERRLEGVGLRMDEILHLGGLRTQEQRWSAGDRAKLLLIVRDALGGEGPVGRRQAGPVCWPKGPPPPSPSAFASGCAKANAIAPATIIKVDLLMIVLAPLPQSAGPRPLHLRRWPTAIRKAGDRI